MGRINQPIKIASYALIGVGVVLLGLNLFLRGTVNIALPLVFLMLGGGLLILVFATLPKYPWIAIFYIPAALLLTFGVVFLINVLTNDWNSWAYAWLLLLASMGVGMLLTNREMAWHPAITVIGICLTAGGVVLFALFGAIAGGLFIQVMAPVMLVLGGIGLFWLRPETVFPEHILKRLRRNPASENPLPGAPAALELKVDPPEALVEPLSVRELEVLRMVDSGLSNQQIALKLTIAPSTVKTHINNIYGKLAVQTRVQAIHRARDLGLLER